MLPRCAHGKMEYIRIHLGSRRCFGENSVALHFRIRRRASQAHHKYAFTCIVARVHVDMRKWFTSVTPLAQAYFFEEKQCCHFGVRMVAEPSVDVLHALRPSPRFVV